jgi:hypothetical protein
MMAKLGKKLIKDAGISSAMSKGGDPNEEKLPKFKLEQDHLNYVSRLVDPVPRAPIEFN